MKKILLAACLLSAAPALADWPLDAGTDVPVANVDTSQTPSVIADNQGGAFVVFAHVDSADNKTLRGEHFDQQGNRLWSVAVDAGLYLGEDLLGVSLGTLNLAQALAFTLSLQRFDSAGAPVWAPTTTNGGVQLLANLDYYSYYYAIPDGLGGALTLYQTTAGTVSQHLDSTGALHYGVSGYLIGDVGINSGAYAFPYFSSDDQGGLYFIYAPTGAETISPVISYVTPAGAAGFSVPNAAPSQTYSSEWGSVGLPDGAGIWAAWTQSGTYGVYLQEFLADGGTAFPDAGDAGGLLVASTSTYQVTPELLNDGQGGVVVAWFDDPAGTNAIFVQHYASDGGALWAQPAIVSNGSTTPTIESSYLETFQLIAAPDDDVAVFWNANPSGIYAEKLDLDTGTHLWGPLTGGVVVSSAAPEYVSWMQAAFASDDSAYVTYQAANDVYLKHLRADGTLGTTVADAGEDAGVDAGVDAGFDAGFDAGIEDAGTDAGTTVDAGSDAGPDAGSDAGSVEDAGPDAGSGLPDSGPVIVPDAGPVADAGQPVADAGVGDGGNTVTASSGCGCTTAPDAPLWALGFGLMWLTRLRRRAR